MPAGSITPQVTFFGLDARTTSVNANVNRTATVRYRNSGILTVQLRGGRMLQTLKTSPKLLLPNNLALLYMQTERLCQLSFH